MAMGGGSRKGWRPTGVTGVGLPGAADLGSSRPQLMPGSCLLGRVEYPLGPAPGSRQALGSAATVSTWGLQNFSVFYSQPQIEPFWHPQCLRGHLLRPETGRGISGQGSKPCSVFRC